MDILFMAKTLNFFCFSLYNYLKWGVCNVQLKEVQLKEVLSQKKRTRRKGQAHIKPSQAQSYKKCCRPKKRRAPLFKHAYFVYFLHHLSACLYRIICSSKVSMFLLDKCKCFYVEKILSQN